MAMADERAKSIDCKEIRIWDPADREKLRAHIGWGELEVFGVHLYDMKGNLRVFITADDDGKSASIEVLDDRKNTRAVLKVDANEGSVRVIGANRETLASLT